MKFLFSLALIGLGGMMVPGVLEGAPNACSALEQVAVDEQTQGSTEWERGLGVVGLELSQGRYMEEIIRKEHPGVPPQAACAGYYWANHTVNVVESVADHFERTY